MKRIKEILLELSNVRHTREVGERMQACISSEKASAHVHPCYRTVCSFFRLVAFTADISFLAVRRMNYGTRKNGTQSSARQHTY